MSKELTFNQVVEKHSKTLDLYVPVVARVHGGSHPEFHKVRALFDSINSKIKEAGLNKAELTQEFARLRETTQDYTVPDDVCESYEAVYNMLAEIDKVYHS